MKQINLPAWFLQSLEELKKEIYLKGYEDGQRDAQHKSSPDRYFEMNKDEFRKQDKGGEAINR